MRIYQGDTWEGSGTNLQNVSGVGIGTSSDAVNRLSVSSEATLLNHAGAGYQLKLNKSAPEETVSLLYQSDWVGHAEMGLTGDTDFHIRVSADGTSWSDALVVDTTTGLVTGYAVNRRMLMQASGRSRASWLVGGSLAWGWQRKSCLWRRMTT